MSFATAIISIITVARDKLSSGTVAIAPESSGIEHALPAPSLRQGPKDGTVLAVESDPYLRQMLSAVQQMTTWEAATAATTVISPDRLCSDNGDASSDANAANAQRGTAADSAMAQPDEAALVAVAEDQPDNGAESDSAWGPHQQQQ